MAPPEGIHTLAGRLETFNSAHHAAKRRASSTRKRAPAALTWPHSFLKPEELARAGFYFQPAAESPDNCVCFVCERQLDGWEAGDNPVLEHVTHSQSCGWAINADIAHSITNGQVVNEDPLGERLVAARSVTFLGLWPHEHKKGWKCKMSKMVDAGWIYDSSPEYDDGVTCPYCGLSLDGWEPKDNPMDEHKKREPNCHFFSMIESFAASRKQIKAKKPRASRTSKASRLSTQSNPTIISEAPSLSNLDDLAAMEDDTVLTTASTATKGGKKTKPPATKSTRGRPKKKPEQEDEANSSIAPDDSALASQPSRTTTRKVSRARSSQMDVTVIESQPSKSTRARGTKPKTKKRMTDDQSQLHAELQAAIDASMGSEGNATPQLTRGIKRTSDGIPKQASSAGKRNTQSQVLDSSLVTNEAPAQTEASQEEKPKRGRKPKKQTNVEPRSSTAVDSGPIKSATKSKKGRKVTKQAAVEPEPMQEPMSKTVEGEQMDDVLPSQQAEDKKSTPEPSQDETYSDPATPTPARPSIASIRRPASSVKKPTPVVRKESTPSQSPQSSDAENKPPSSRPALRALQLQALSPMRIPLTSTPRTSPTRRNALSGITSTLPWSPTDLEEIFLANSPRKQQASDSEGGDKENFPLDPELNLNKLEKKDLAEVVRVVKAKLKAAERKMTVEQWVRWNAVRGEDKLKTECEALVSMFEREGGRALRVLESIRSEE